MSKHETLKLGAPSRRNGTTHWMDFSENRQRGLMNCVPIRMSAEVIVKLNELKNSLTGEKKTLHDVHTEAGETGEEIEGMFA